MKKATISFLAVSLSTAITFQNIVVTSNAEEMNTTQISQDSSINNSSEHTTDRISFIDPLSNPTNRVGNEISSSINSNLFKSAALTPVNPFSYPKINTLGEVTASTLNVRENPSTSSKVLTTLNKGNVVQILSKEDGWYKISYYYRKQVSSSKYDLVFNEAYVSGDYINTVSVKEKGIDVSKWNDTINWSKVKASGVDYAIIRAGYGTDTVDPMFKTNIEGAIKAGVKVGVYWFSYASSPEKAKIEAQKCLEVIAPYKNNISYPVFFDFEESSANWVKNNYNITVTKSLGTSMANAFMDTVKSQGYTPGLYTGIPLQQYFSDELLDSAYTWLAQYSYRSSYPKQFSMWQYGDDGYIDGISGSVDINYTIGTSTPTSRPSISTASVNDISSKTYTGSAIKPSVTVTLDGKTLKLNEDYTVTYSNNTSIGTGRITIKGTGNYTGTKTVSFKIVPKAISNVNLTKKTTSSLTLSWSKMNNVTGYKIYKYNPSSNSYEILKTISNNSTTSYTDESLDSASVYSYKVRAYSKDSSGNYYYGRYSDVFSESTKVKPVKNLKLDSRKATSLSISWDKVDNADGYKIYRLDVNTDTYKLIHTIDNNSTTSFTHDNRLSATNHYYKVKAYKYLNGSTRHSDYSSRLKATTRPVQPSLSLSSTTSKSIKASWTKISKRTTGYEVRMSTSKDKTFSSLGTTTNTSFTKKSLTKGKTYYFKVRAYRIVDGEKIYSLYSSVKSIKCK